MFTFTECFHFNFLSEPIVFSIAIYIIIGSKINNNITSLSWECIFSAISILHESPEKSFYCINDIHHIQNNLFTIFFRIPCQ